MKLQDNKITKNKKKIIDREKAKELTLKAAKILDDKKLEDIKVLDLDGITSLSDFFILATANSSPQMKAGADAVYKEFKKEEGILPYSENDNTPESLAFSLSIIFFLFFVIFMAFKRLRFYGYSYIHERRKGILRFG